MTRREAVIRALRHEETPVLPYHLEFIPQEAEKTARATGDPDIKDFDFDTFLLR